MPRPKKATSIISDMKNIHGKIHTELDSINNIHSSQAPELIKLTKLAKTATSQSKITKVMNSNSTDEEKVRTQELLIAINKQIERMTKRIAFYKTYNH